MKIGFLGFTEKRPFLYTTLKILQGLGDSVLFVTTNLQYARLIMDEDYELEDIDGVFKAGAFQNTTVIVTSLTMDDLGPNGLNVIHPDEFQHCIYDNQVGAEVDYTLFIKGLEISQEEREALELLSETEYTTLEFGFGKKPIRYNEAMFRKCEEFEARHYLVEIDRKISVILCKLFSELLDYPLSNLRKVVARK